MKIIQCRLQTVKINTSSLEKPGNQSQKGEAKPVNKAVAVKKHTMGGYQGHNEDHHVCHALFFMFLLLAIQAKVIGGKLANRSLVSKFRGGCPRVASCIGG